MKEFDARDHYAMAALAGLLSDAATIERMAEAAADEWLFAARLAYKYADMMLIARIETRPNGY